MKIIRIINKIFWRYYKSPEDYARHIGVKVGKNPLINTRNFGSEPYLITIGDNVVITRDVHLHTHGGVTVAHKDNPDFDIFGKIKIEDWVYIGTGSQIMPGVTIGEGSLIAAGSIVTKSVPPGEVWGGIPAKKICRVFSLMFRKASSKNT